MSIRFSSAAGLAPAVAFSLVLAVPGHPLRAEQDIVRRQHGDWTVQCRKAQGQPFCMAFTVLKASNGAKAGILGAQPVAGQRLLSLSMESGYSLGSRIELRVDGNPASRHDECENLYCHILLGADDPLQVQLRRGNQLYVRGGSMDFQASLIGYTAAQETSTELQKARR